MDIMTWNEYYKMRLSEDSDDDSMQALADIAKNNAADIAKAKNPVNQPKVNAKLQKTIELIKKNKLAANKPSAAAKAVDIGAIVSNNS